MLFYLKKATPASGQERADFQEDGNVTALRFRAWGQRPQERSQEQGHRHSLLGPANSVVTEVLHQVTHQ